MELFHLHLKGMNDNKYKEGSILDINPNKFNNRLYTRIYTSNVTVSCNDYRAIVDVINRYAIAAGLGYFDDRMNIGEIFDYALRRQITPEELYKLLTDARDIILPMGTNLREMAMEEYRRDNCPDKPSRLHSLYACSEEGLSYWSKRIYDGVTDVLRIEVEDNPFVSNEKLLPDEGLDYSNKIINSYKYFNPKSKDLDPTSNEYLIQGKVRILEKVDEIRRG